MPKKPTRRTSPSRTRLDKKVLRRKAKNLKRKGKSRTDATPPPARPRGVRESLKQPILDLYHKGKSVNQIAATLSTSPNRVYIHLHRAALSPLSPPVPELEWYPHDNCVSSLKTDHWIEVEGRSPRVFQPWFEQGKIGPAFNSLRLAMLECERHAAGAKGEEWWRSQKNIPGDFSNLVKQVRSIQPPTKPICSHPMDKQILTAACASCGEVTNWSPLKGIANTNIERHIPHE